jgi:mono/diheme cytochrome c family protein
MQSNQDSSASALALGAEVYARDCASCHGRNGEGEPNWGVARDDGTLPAPPHDSSGHTWHHADPELLRIIADGGTAFSEKSNMPGYRGRLSQEDMEAVLRYIKTFWGSEERAYQEDQSRAWQQMLESSEMTTEP